MKSIEYNLIIKIGAEVQTDKCKIIRVFLNEEIKSRKFDEILDEIKDQDGISIIPHPFKNKMHKTDLWKKVDLIEGLNARTSRKLNLKVRILAKQFGLPVIAGSEAHTSFEIGQVRTIIEEENIDSDKIKQSFLKGNMVLAGLNHLFFYEC